MQHQTSDGRSAFSSTTAFDILTEMVGTNSLPPDGATAPNNLRPKKQPGHELETVMPSKGIVWFRVHEHNYIVPEASATAIVEAMESQFPELTKPILEREFSWFITASLQFIPVMASFTPLQWWTSVVNALIVDPNSSRPWLVAISAQPWALHQVVAKAILGRKFMLTNSWHPLTKAKKTRGAPRETALAIDAFIRQVKEKHSNNRIVCKDYLERYEVKIVMPTEPEFTKKGRQKKPRAKAVIEEFAPINKGGSGAGGFGNNVAVSSDGDIERELINVFDGLNVEDEDEEAGPAGGEDD